MILLNEKSIAATINAIMSVATITSTALFWSSLQVGHVTL